MQTANRIFEMEPVNAAIPGFAIHALAMKTRDWANHFNNEHKHEAAEAWYAVAEALDRAQSTYNIRKGAKARMAASFTVELGQYHDDGWVVRDSRTGAKAPRPSLFDYKWQAIKRADELNAALKEN